MKEIGQALKEARETIGISKNEVIKDLNITEGQLDNIEDGNINAFKDVFFLKDTLRIYAKYLNVDVDEIMDKFNDFMFSFTSRIPVDDILEQTKEIELQESKNEESKVVSPYTVKRKNNNLKYTFIYIAGVLLLIILVFLMFKFLINKDSLVNCIDMLNGGRV